MTKENLLFELGCEELPPKALKKLAISLHDSLKNYLTEQQLLESDSRVEWFATPRRLAVKLDNVLDCQPTQTIERKGPAVQAAYDKEGNPTKAALGFAKSVGVELTELSTLKTEQGEWLYFNSEQAGQSLSQLIQAGIEQAIKKMPIPKRMRWGDSSTEFVRPVHWLVLLHGSTVLPVEILATQSGRVTQGHRFHGSGDIELMHADDYEETLLEKGSVMVNYQARRSLIEKECLALAAEKSLHLVTNESLLDEVTGLVEMPHVIMGRIDESFLSLPKEVLISSMHDHQKYFSLVGDDQALAPYFITVSNINSKDMNQVIHGNERVLRARLADAEFFWQQDQHQLLAQHAEKLSSVLFHHKLGSLDSKVTRMSSLAVYINEKLSELANGQYTNAQNNSVKLAARLAKADLVTGMVAEFPELQGVMGRYYALSQNVEAQVAIAIDEHYLPRQAGDNLPSNDIACAVAIADKLDTVCGLFLANELPTGDKDPFALRRQALGILRILIEKQWPLSLLDLVEFAINNYQGNDVFDPQNVNEKVAQTSQFIIERLKNYYQSQDISTNVYLSVAEIHPTKPLEFDQRVKAVDSFQKNHQNESQSLASANKRIHNILEKNKSTLTDINVDKLILDEEKTLVNSIESIRENVEQMMLKGDYLAVLSCLVNLHQPIDAFFEHVKVIDDDASVRDNRLAILQNLRKLFTGVADIAYLNQS